MKRTFCYLLILILTLGNGGCSYVTKSGRQQAAYARYVRRSSYARVRMQRKMARAPKIKAQATDPTISTSSGPESVSPGSDSQ